VNSNVLLASSIAITCGDSSIYTSDQRTNEYSKRFDTFANDNHFILQSATVASLEKGGILDSSLLALERDLGQILFLTNGGGYVSRRVVQPVRSFLKGIVERWDRLTTYAANAAVSPGEFIRQESMARPSNGVLLRTAGHPIETYLLIGRFAHSFSMKAPGWILKVLHDQPERKVSMDLAMLSAYLIGDECVCEVAYGLFRRTSATLGLDYTACTDSLPQYLRELASRDSASHCLTTRTELDFNCSVLATKSVSSVAGLDRNHKQINRILNADTMYVLHFWGMWCAPCIQQHPDIMRVADTLQQMGCNMIHVAGDNSPKFDTWKKFVEDQSGEHLFTSRSDARSSIGERLAVSSYPSYVVLGKNGEILGRADAYYQLVPMIRSAQLGKR